MQEPESFKEPAEGGLPFAEEAAERYGASERVSTWQAVRERWAIKPSVPRRPSWPEYSYNDFVDELAAWKRHPAVRNHARLQRSYADARHALFRDMIERLARGELVAFGTIYWPGSLGKNRGPIEPERWRYFVGWRGQALRFGPSEASIDVREVLIYRRELVIGAGQPAVALAGPTPRLRVDALPGSRADPRNKSAIMIEGLEKALEAGSLTRGTPVTLVRARRAMLAALGYKEDPPGMHDDAFAKHCKPWLKEHGIYG